MIKAVIFDMFETLITLFEGRTYFSEDIAADVGLPEDFFRKEWHITEPARTRGEYTIEEALTITLKKLGIYSADLVQQIAKKRRDALGDTFAAIPDDTIRLLKTLHEKGLSVGLISNTFSDERDMIRSSQLNPLFDAVMISYEQGICKPDPAIFNAMMKALNVKADECLYVGDGGSRELFAAREIGMTAVQCTWFHDRAFEPHIPCPLLDEFPHVDTQMDVIKFIENLDGAPASGNNK
ncbi:MAG: HAD-IA family hydrolase [Spirochaetaceae bacterium]|nr:HAD-IA family hydrolase [Spirochaetaceae bacterium]